MSMKSALMALSLLFVSPLAWSLECKSLVAELKAMKAAQKAIVTSLAENHGSFAKELTEVATEAEASNGTMPKTVMKSLRVTAKAYKTRGEKAETQGRKLDEATAELISQVEACMASR